MIPLLWLALAVGVAEPSPKPKLTPSQCAAEARELYGNVASADVVARAVPKSKSNAAKPNLPQVPAGTTGSDVMPAHELLVAPDGRVSKVWTLREPSFKPPFPAFNAAIVAALRQHEFEPVRVEGRAVPFCLTVSTLVHWK